MCRFVIAMKKLKIDDYKCIGCGLCPSIAEKSFILVEKISRAEVINPAGDTPEKIQEAIDACPVQAIS